MARQILTRAGELARVTAVLLLLGYVILRMELRTQLLKKPEKWE